MQRAECLPISNTDERYRRLKREALQKPTSIARKVIQLNSHVQTYKPIAKHAANIRVTIFFV